MSPWTVDQDLGSTSWTWPSMPPCRQKLVDITMFDPHRQYFKRGGHMPLMVFFWSYNQQRRTKGACEIRERRQNKEDGGRNSVRVGRVGAVGMIGDMTPVVTGVDWRGWR